MPKKKRRPTAAGPTFMTTAGWRWRSFPVFFAFVCGAFVMAMLNGPTNPVGLVAVVLAFFGVAFGLAHMTTRWLVERRARRHQATPAPSPTEAGQAAGRRPRVPQGTPRRR